MRSQVLSWDTVVQRIVELQRTVRLCIVKDQLTAHDIANRILRKENFMIAFVNQMLLPLQAKHCSHAPCRKHLTRACAVHPRSRSRICSLSIC